MSGTILTFSLIFAQLALAAAALLAGLRIVRGPRAQDRVLGLDAFYVIAMLTFLVTGMRSGSPFLYEAALIVGGMGFVATVALAKFLIRGEVIE